MDIRFFSSLRSELLYECNACALKYCNKLFRRSSVIQYSYNYTIHLIRRTTVCDLSRFYLSSSYRKLSPFTIFYFSLILFINFLFSESSRKASLSFRRTRVHNYPPRCYLRYNNDTITSNSSKTFIHG